MLLHIIIIILVIPVNNMIRINVISFMHYNCLHVSLIVHCRRTACR